jgi:hypothetical protein
MGMEIYERGPEEGKEVGSRPGSVGSGFRKKVLGFRF